LESFGKLAVRHSELFSPSDDFQNIILIQRKSWFLAHGKILSVAVHLTRTQPEFSATRMLGLIPRPNLIPPFPRIRLPE
jgi:hypothetical protein